MEITLGDQKFSFDSLEAIFDTSTQATTCNFRVFDRASNSNMIWEILTGSDRIIGTYKYPGELYPGRSLVYLHLQTYVNRVPGTYTPQNDSLSLAIYQLQNGRLRGTLSGKVKCLTCATSGAVVKITNGEFEMPYSYR